MFCEILRFSVPPMNVSSQNQDVSKDAVQVKLHQPCSQLMLCFGTCRDPQAFCPMCNSEIVTDFHTGIYLFASKEFKCKTTKSKKKKKVFKNPMY